MFIYNFKLLNIAIYGSTADKNPQVLRQPKMLPLLILYNQRKSHKPQNCHEIFIRRNITIGRQKPLNYENIIEGADHKRIPNVQQRVSVFVGEKKKFTRLVKIKEKKKYFNSIKTKCATKKLHKILKLKRTSLKTC